MTIIAGIDEAGYGPTLGPLIVAAAVFRLEEGSKEKDLNHLVQLKADHGGLRIGDSKQLYHSGTSINRIETTTLGHAVLGRGVLPVRFDALLEGSINTKPEEIQDLPWYQDRLLSLPLPRASHADDILSRATIQQSLLAEQGISFLDFTLIPIMVPQFNRLTKSSKSKAWTLFYAAARLIEELVRRYPDDELIIHLDRHGGRIHYGPMLQSLFPLAPFTTVQEKREESIYALHWPGRNPVHIDFRVKADAVRTPVALASVIAKTVRELFMECINQCFMETCDGLQPTAGYPEDARRFLDAVDPQLEKMGKREQLIRCR